MSDLHNLTRKHGTDTVAGVLGCSVRALEDLRAGHTAITVDDLYELERAFPGFDATATIRRIGAVRVAKGRSRRLRNAPPPPEVCEVCHNDPEGCPNCREELAA